MGNEGIPHIICECWYWDLTVVCLFSDVDFLPHSGSNVGKFSAFSVLDDRKLIILEYLML